MIGIATEKDVSARTQNSETAASAQERKRSIPSRAHCQLAALLEQREAFIRDRFSTTLEDPLTGKRIRP